MKPKFKKGDMVNYLTSPYIPSDMPILVLTRPYNVLGDSYYIGSTSYMGKYCRIEMIESSMRPCVN